MEIRITRNRAFWLAYIVFCVAVVTGLQLTGEINLATMDRGQQLIVTALLVACGVVWRYWFKINYRQP